MPPPSGGGRAFRPMANQSPMAMSAAAALSNVVLNYVKLFP
jgi:hypothetical protein